MKPRWESTVSSPDSLASLAQFADMPTEGQRQDSDITLTASRWWVLRTRGSLQVAPSLSTLAVRTQAPQGQGVLAVSCTDLLSYPHTSNSARPASGFDMLFSHEKGVYEAWVLAKHPADREQCVTGIHGQRVRDTKRSAQGLSAPCALAGPLQDLSSRCHHFRLFFAETAA